ncbi:MAG TPA: LEA type 2 family protein [Ignavibacteria bacterium]
MRYPTIKFLLLIFLSSQIFLISSCQYHAKPEFVKIIKVEINNSNLTKVDLFLYAEFRNPNPATATLNKSEYKIYVNDVLLGFSNDIIRETLSPEQNTEIKIPLVISTIDFLNSGIEVIKSMLLGNPLNYRLKGSFEFKIQDGNIKIDIDKTDNLSAILI